jgi:hypothetical protein
MKKSINKRLLIILMVGILAFVWFKVISIHTPVFNNNNERHMFIFNDSLLENINKPSYSWVSEQDTLTNFVFSEILKNKKTYYELNDTCNNYYVSIWEFNALKKSELDDVFINEHSVIGKSEFLFESKLNGEGDYPISIKYLYKIDGFVLNLGENSKLIKELKGVNYKGFYGLVDKMSICDKEGNPQIYFNYKKLLQPIVLLLYKGHGGVYLITIYSSRKLDENVIKILNFI